ncbi:MAG: hypothetical protein AAGG81_07650, partial [Chlamydiota bacterium]
MTLIKYNTSREIVLYQGKENQKSKNELSILRGIPNFPHLLNTIFIDEVYGNSHLSNADVICLSDYHCDPFQKYLRAHIINKIFIENSFLRKLLFLVEGTHYGQPASFEDVETLIGSKLINNYFNVVGWDHDQLMRKGLKKIRKLQRFCSEYKQLFKDIAFLRKYR